MPPKSGAWTPPRRNRTSSTCRPTRGTRLFDEITIAFNEPVAGLDLADLTLTLAGGGNLLTGGERLTSVDGMNWTLGDLAGLTAAAGQYVVTLSAAGSSIQDGSGNLLAQDAERDLAGRHHAADRLDHRGEFRPAP